MERPVSPPVVFIPLLVVGVTQHRLPCAALVILFSVLRDRKGMTTDELQDIWASVMDRSDSINQGYCNLSDLRDTLAQEDGIYIR